MKESYVEYMVARKPHPLALLIKVFVYALVAVFLFLGFWLSGWLLLVAIGLGIVAYIFLPELDLEFEYLYLDKEITIDKIIAKQRRKRVAVLDLNKMEFLAPYTSHELDSYKARKVSEKDYSSKNPDARPYGLLYHDRGGDVLYLIEPNEEMLRAIRTVFPRKVMEF